MTRPGCDCFDEETPVATWPALEFHWDVQDTTSDAWQHLLALVDEAAADGRTTFAPLQAMTPAERTQIVTLPATIGQLTAVRDLNLYGSHLVWLPPEIGAMASLETFVPYTSWCLHWFPYEITRCTQLRDSTVSTRSLYGNFKYRWPFPPLSAETLGVGTAVGAVDTGMQACSVCQQVVPRRTMQQVWISRLVATDVLPLLVHACSAACIAALPPGAANHIAGPHRGGIGVAQPLTDWEARIEERRAAGLYDEEEGI